VDGGGKQPGVGRLPENVVQAVARDVLSEGIQRAEGNFGLTIVGHVHDELICGEPELIADQRLQHLNEALSAQLSGLQVCRSIPTIAKHYIKA
jgi:hypothetical protein